MSEVQRRPDGRALPLLFGGWNRSSDPTRFKVFCTNWSVPDAPQAHVIVERGTELLSVRRFATWEQALAWAVEQADHIRLRVRQAEPLKNLIDRINKEGSDG